MRQALRIVSALTACAAVVLGAGCGLKGPLTMPERSSNVVIRGPSGEVVGGPASTGATGTTGATDSGAAATAPGTATSPVPSATKKPATDPDRMPPPPLPGGNPGSPGG